MLPISGGMCSSGTRRGFKNKVRSRRGRFPYGHKAADCLSPGINKLSLDNTCPASSTSHDYSMAIASRCKIGVNDPAMNNYASVLSRGSSTSLQNRSPISQSTPNRPFNSHLTGSGNSQNSRGNRSTAHGQRYRGLVPIDLSTSQNSTSSFSAAREQSVSTEFRSVNKFHAPITLSIGDFVQPRTPPTTVQTTDKPRLGIVNECRPIGKVREIPKTKRPSRLKRTLLNERSLRRSRQCISAPACPRSTMLVGSGDENEQMSALELPSTNTFPRNAEQDRLVLNLLNRLTELQDRSFVKHANTPHHRKRLKRYVCGLREVVKYLQLNRMRMLLVARNLENGAIRLYRDMQGTCMPYDGPTTDLSALENILVQIWNLALQTDPITPILVTHTRQRLAQVCHKPGRVSVIGILSVAGAEEIAAELLAQRSAINRSSKSASCSSLH